MGEVTVVTVGDTSTAVIAAWAQESGQLRIVRRCRELAELLAVCQSGLAQAAVIASPAKELTATLVDRLAAVGVAVVAIADSAEQGRRLRDIGVTVVVGEPDTAALTQAVHAAVDRRRHPEHSGYSVPDRDGPRSQHPYDAGISPSAITGANADGQVGDAPGSAGGSRSGPGGEAAADAPPNESGPRSNAGAPLAEAESSEGDTSPSGGGAISHGFWSRNFVARAKRNSTGPARGVPSGGGAPDRSGTVVAVWGPIGSPGRTTVAINMAAEYAAAGHPVLLIDADSYGASIAAALGLLDESASFAQACRAADQGVLTLVHLAKTATQVVFDGGAFSLLTGLTRADRWPELRSTAVERVLTMARQMAEVVIVDCGFALENDEELSYDTVAPRRNAATLAVLAHADRVYAVGTGDVVGVPRLLRGLAELREAFPAAEVQVVINKVRRKAVGGSPEKALAQAWERFGPAQGISHFLPWDSELTDKALLEGRLLMELQSDAPLRRAIREMSCAAAQQKSKKAVSKPTAKAEFQG